MHLRTIVKSRPLLTGILLTAALCASTLLVPSVRFRAGLGWMKVRGLFGPVDVDFGPARLRLQSALDPSVSLPLPDSRIAISKSAHRLDLYSGPRLIKSYKAAFGAAAPSGSKTAKGDLKTPEGEYHLCTRQHSQYHLFLGINFPSEADAKLAFEKSAITQANFDAISRAERNRDRPPWETSMGGCDWNSRRRHSERLDAWMHRGG